MGLGEQLRAARQRKGLTLGEAEAATKVRQRYLEALEEEDYGALPPTVYTVGFLRCYAAYLGLNVEQAVRTFYRETGIREAPEIQPEAQPIRTSFYLGPQMVVGSVVLVLCLGLIAYVGTQIQIFVQAQAQRGLEARLASNPLAPPQPPVPTPATTNTGPVPSFPKETGGVTLDLRIVDNPTYLRVFVDGRKEVDRMAMPGETLRTFVGSESIYIQVSDANSVEVTLNGRRLPDRLGPRGMMLDRIWYAPGR